METRTIKPLGPGVLRTHLPSHVQALNELGKVPVQGLPINHHHTWLLCYPGNIEGLTVITDRPARPIVE